MMRVRTHFLCLIALMAGCAAPSSLSQARLQDLVLAPPLGWDLKHNLLFATYSATTLRTYELMVFCDPATLTFFYRLPADAPAMTSATFTSGRLISTVPASSYPEYVSLPPTASAAEPKVAMVVRADVDAADPVLRRFLATGELAISAGAYRLVATARAGDLPKFRVKLDACQRPGR